MPVEERNILLTGDPDTSFDPYVYMWIYSFPQIAAQNPLVQQHFLHILQFEDQFQEELPAQVIPQIQRRRRAESWKNTTASEWKAPARLRNNQPAPTSIVTRAAARRLQEALQNAFPDNVNIVCAIEAGTDNASATDGEWTTVDYR